MHRLRGSGETASLRSRRLTTSLRQKLRQEKARHVPSAPASGTARLPSLRLLSPYAAVTPLPAKGPFPNSGGRLPLRYIAWATRTARYSAGQAPQCGKYLLLLARLAEIHTALSDWAALRYGRFSETSLHFFAPYRIGAIVLGGIHIATPGRKVFSLCLRSCSCHTSTVLRASCPCRSLHSDSTFDVTPMWGKATAFHAQSIIPLP